MWREMLVQHSSGEDDDDGVKPNDETRTQNDSPNDLTRTFDAHYLLAEALSSSFA